MGERKRTCLNCKHRSIEGASDFCTYSEKHHYLHYSEVFEHWCKHWAKYRSENKTNIS